MSHRLMFVYIQKSFAFCRDCNLGLFSEKKSEFFLFPWTKYERLGLGLRTSNRLAKLLCQHYLSISHHARRYERQHCDGADGARDAYKFYYSVRISYEFLISDCRGDSDLGLCSS